MEKQFDGWSNDLCFLFYVPAYLPACMYAHTPCMFDAQKPTEIPGSELKGHCELPFQFWDPIVGHPQNPKCS